MAGTQVLTASHNHNKITTKIQNNNQSETPKIWLNESYNQSSNESYIETGRRDGDTKCAGMIPICGTFSFGREIVAMEASCEEQRVPVPHQTSSPEFQSMEEKSL